MNIKALCGMAWQGVWHGCSLNGVEKYRTCVWGWDVLPSGYYDEQHSLVIYRNCNIRHPTKALLRNAVVIAEWTRMECATR